MYIRRFTALQTFLNCFSTFNTVLILKSLYNFKFYAFINIKFVKRSPHPLIRVFSRNIKIDRALREFMTRRMTDDIRNKLISEIKNSNIIKI